MASTLSADSYALNPFVLPEFIGLWLVLGLGLVILLRERDSRAAAPFALTALTLAAWFATLTAVYLATRPGVASFWMHAGQVAVALIPAALYQFTTVVTDMRRHRAVRLAVRVCWLTSAVMAAVALLAESYLIEPRRFWWGYYPVYGAAGYLMPAYYALVISAISHHCWRAYRRAGQGATSRRRARLFLLALGIAGPGAVIQFVPSFGVPLYPPGALLITSLLVVLAYIAVRYRLVDITPAFAAHQIIQTMGDAVIVTDRDGLIRLANHAALELLERSWAQLEAQPLVTVLGEAVAPIRRELDSGGHVREQELIARSSSGAERVLSISASLMRDRHARALARVYVVRDITARKKDAERIHFLAYYDGQTGLPNRFLVVERLAECLAQPRTPGQALALLVLDVDRFKLINETLGHSVGDDLLASIARRLRHCLTPPRPAGGPETSGRYDLLGRLGGDEFVFLLDPVGDAEEAARMAQRVIDALATPIAAGGRELYVTASVGIALHPHDGSNAESLLKNADAAMHAAKDQGRNRYRFFDASINEAVRERLSLEMDLRRALERGELWLAYQPVVDARDGALVGAEALLRWQHPDRGLLLPGRFMEQAEESGLILPIGEWVLRTACRQAAAWHRTGGEALRLSVNLSGSQFMLQDDLPGRVEWVLRETGLPAHALELEITENVLMETSRGAAGALKRLKGMGSRLAVDDFGTGYSSLTYLKRFPIDTLKIDQSFVREAGTDPESGAITRAVIALARSLELAVISEGVETERQRGLLIDQGCHLMQGLLFGEPLPADEFETRVLHRGAEGRWAPDGG